MDAGHQSTILVRSFLIGIFLIAHVLQRYISYITSLFLLDYVCIVNSVGNFSDNSEIALLTEIVALGFEIVH